MTNISSLPNNKTLKTLLSWLIKLLGITLFIYVLKNVDWKICIEEMSKISIFSLVIALFMIQIGYLIKSKRWQIILTHYEVEITVWKLFKIFSIGTFLGLVTPGKIGDFGRLFYIKKYIDVKKGLSSLFIDRIFDLISLGILGFVSILYFENNFKIINKISIQFGYDKQYFLIGVILSMLVLYIILRKKIISIIQTIKDGFKDFISFLKQLFITIISMILIYGAFVVVCYNMNIQIHYLGLFFGIVLIGLLSLIPITVLGLGVREVSMVYIFDLYGLGFEKAIALSLIMLMIQIISTIPGIIWFSKKPLNFNKINN
jgi:uncharacterized protein (TIRG00374 family)